MSTARLTESIAGFRAHVRQDLLASVVVFLVALPLCMGIAIASGAPVAAGLITGIVGGIVVGFLAGCPLQVSGPAAGLTVIVYKIVQDLGIEMLGLVVLVAGALQVGAGLLRLGQWFRAVSPAVIIGMLSGIGFLILGSQFHVMIDDQPKGDGAQNLGAIPAAIVKGFGMPELEPREVREHRTAALQEIGELHRAQFAIEERLHEYRPRLTEGTEDAPAIPPDALARLTADQEQLTERMRELVAGLTELEADTASTERSAVILAAAEQALERSEATLAALLAGDAPAASQTQADAVASLNGLLGAIKNHNVAALIGLLTIGLIVGWKMVAPKKLQVIPAPLVAVVIATTLAAFLSLPVLYVQVPDNLLQDLHFPTLAVISAAPWGAVMQAAILMAVVASAETLLCCTAVDQMQNGPRTKYDRELFAQGIGNTICGALGALPMTGVIVRSSANVQAGGKTRMSAVFHGVWLLIFVVWLSFMLRLIPTASLAAILVYTGYKLINVGAIRKLRQYGWSEVAIAVVTITMIVFTDLLVGVVTGIALSAIKLLYTFSHLRTDLQVVPEERKAVLGLEGAATFVRLPILAAQLEKVPPGTRLHVDFEHLDYIDHACLDLLMTWAKQHQATGGELVLDWESLHARFRGAEANGAPVNGAKRPASPTKPQPEIEEAVST